MALPRYGPEDPSMGVPGTDEEELAPNAILITGPVSFEPQVLHSSVLPNPYPGGGAIGPDAASRDQERSTSPEERQCISTSKVTIGLPEQVVLVDVGETPESRCAGTVELGYVRPTQSDRTP